MSGFDAHWLALREPADARSRSGAQAIALAGWAAGRCGGRVLRLVDLGCGSGSNLRYLAPRLPSPQHWTCIDDDAALLAKARRESADHREVATRSVDLAHGLEGSIDADTDIVTASALLDLVSGAWLEALVAALVDARAAGLFALSVDGRCRLDPPHAEDARVQAAFDAHQQRDKGFGPAVGAHAADAIVPLLQQRGYRVDIARSDWALDARTDAALLVPLLEGIASAAIEQGGEAVRAPVAAWLQQRLREAAESRLRVVIGHVDVLALPVQ